MVISADFVMKVSKVKDTLTIDGKERECIRIVYEDDFEFFVNGEKQSIQKGSRGPLVVGNPEILDEMTNGYVSDDTVIIDPNNNIKIGNGTIIINSKIVVDGNWAFLEISDSFIYKTKIEIPSSSIRSVKIERSKLINTNTMNPIIIANSEIISSITNNIAAIHTMVCDSTITNVNLNRSVVRNAKIVKDRDAAKNQYTILTANIHNPFDFVFFPDSKFHKFGHAAVFGWYTGAKTGIDETKYEFNEELLKNSIMFSLLKDKNIIEASSRILTEGLTDIVYKEKKKRKIDVKDMYIYTWARHYIPLLLEYILCHRDANNDKKISLIESKFFKIDLFKKKVNKHPNGIIDIESLRLIFEYLKIEEDDEEKYIEFLKSQNIVIFNKKTMIEI